MVFIEVVSQLAAPQTNNRSATSLQNYHKAAGCWNRLTGKLAYNGLLFLTDFYANSAFSYNYTIRNAPKDVVFS
jgi:hypothetical protein